MCRGTSALLCLLVLFGAVGASAAPPAGASVRLNEANCEGTDWVELVNTAAEPADVSGWLLTDDPLDGARPDHRYLFPPGTSMAAGSRVVVQRGEGGFPFGISCGSDTLRLADSGGALVDEVAVPELTDPVETWGRYPDGTGPFAQTASTKGEANLPSASSGDPSGEVPEWLFDPGQVTGVDLSLPEASREALEAEPTEYQPGRFTLTAGGKTYGPFEVGIRLKGGRGSFRPLSGKAAFKVKFSHSVPGQRFLGLKTLTLNNMVQDPTGTREVLAYEAFRANGLPAPRTGYAYVRVDGEEYGLYLNVETWDDVSLPRWFPATGHLFEAEYGVDVNPGQASAFELEEGPEDLSDLETLIARVHGGGDFSERVAAVADLRQMTRMWAVEKYIGHWDGYAGRERAGQPNNYFLHSDPAGRFSMLPWGTDQTWTDRLPFGSRAGELFDRCLADPSCAAMYREAVGSVSRAIAALDPGRRLGELSATISASQERDPRDWPSDVRDAWLAVTRDFIRERPGDARRWLDAPLGGSSRDPLPGLPRSLDPALLTLQSSVRRRHPILGAVRRGLRVRARCSRGCRLVARAMLPRRAGRRLGLGSGAAPVMLGRTRVTRLTEGERVVTVRLGRRSRRALRRVRSARVAVEVYAVDANGHIAKAKHRVALLR